MSSANKEQLERVREFLKENPYQARQLIREQPELFNDLLGNNDTNASSMSAQPTMSNSNSQSMGGNSIGGKQFVKTMPGAKIPRMFDWDEQGFSNYLMLAVLAFTIQFIITLICIFFYK